MCRLGEEDWDYIREHDIVRLTERLAREKEAEKAKE